MIDRIRNSHPSPALVIACIALFVSLGGVSYGFATGSIDGREIKNGAVATKDLRNNDIRTGDIRNGTVRGRDIAQNTVGPDDVRESDLAKVPGAALADLAGDSAKLGGRPAAAYAPRGAEPVRIVGAAGQPQFEPGYDQSLCLGNCLPAGFWKDPSGTVHLQGSVDGGDGIAFYLPPGYRPAGSALFSVPSGNGGLGRILVEEDGRVQLVVTGGFAHLDGITFRAAN